MKVRRSPKNAHGLDSVASYASRDSIASFGSSFSAFSAGSIGSIGSLLSIGSIGSIASIGSIGSIASIGSVGSIAGIGKIGEKPDQLFATRNLSAPVAFLLISALAGAAGVLLLEGISGSGGDEIKPDREGGRGRSG